MTTAAISRSLFADLDIESPHTDDLKPSSGKTCRGASAHTTTHSGPSLPVSSVKKPRLKPSRSPLIDIADGSGGGMKNAVNTYTVGRTLVVSMDPKQQRHGGYWTPNTSAWPNDASVCSLSSVLDTGPIPQKYFLSAKACAGILRRADKRGKVLPEQLRVALQAVVDSAQTSTSPADYSQSPTALMGGGMGRLDSETETFIPVVTHALKAEDHDASEDGTGRGVPLVPVAFRTAGDGAVYHEGDRTAPLTTATDPNTHVIAIQERAVSENLDNGPQGKGYQTDVAHTLEARNKVQSVATRWAVRRLLPVECELLQGFPGGWTDVTHRGKPAADGPRYKAIGNSKATTVVRWIGKRILRALCD